MRSMIKKTKRKAPRETGRGFAELNRAMNSWLERRGLRVGYRRGSGGFGRKKVEDVK